MNKNEKMKINFCALMVLLLVLTGYTLIFSDIWVNFKEGVSIGSHYQKFHKQQERQVYPDHQERRSSQATSDMASDRLE